MEEAMGKKITDTLIMTAAAAACLLLTVTVAHGNYKSSTLIYNLVFWAVLVILYVTALITGLFRMNSLTGYFRQASEKIDSVKENDSLSLSSKVQALMGGSPFDQKLETFLYDLNHSRSGICDIEDYINEDETDSMIHKKMLDLLPDVMTSLGILGTFMGLVWGLREFEPSNYEAMTSSVTSLVDGIKVAFLTSIYGLSMSLVFSYSLKSGYSALSDSLQSFLNHFHMNLVPSAEMEAQSRLEKNQKEQSEILKGLALEFSDQVAQGFSASLAPTLDRINMSLGNMMTTITHNQEIFLQDIVDSFVSEMKKTFHTDFEHFGDSIKTMTDAFSQNVLYTEKLYQNMCSEMNNLFVKDENAMHTAVAELSAIQKKYADTVDALSTRYSQMTLSLQKAQEMTMKNLSNAEQESSRFWVACNQAMQNYLIEAAEAYKKFEKSNESNERLLTAITAVYQKNEELIEEYRTQIRNITDAQEDMRQLLKEFSVSQESVNQMMQEFGILLSGIESVESDGRNIYLSHTVQPSELYTKAAESIARVLKESSRKQEKLLEETGKRQEEILLEIKGLIEGPAGNSGKKRRGFNLWG